MENERIVVTNPTQFLWTFDGIINYIMTKIHYNQLYKIIFPVAFIGKII